MSTDASGSSQQPRQQQPRFIDIGANLTDGMFQGAYHGKQYHDPDLSQVRGWGRGRASIDNYSSFPFARVPFAREK